MPDVQKTPTTRPKSGRRPAASSILEQVHCETVSYEIKVPVASFDRKKFQKETGIGTELQWSATLFPKDASSRYHVHFSGSTDDGAVVLTVSYWDKGKPRREDMEPYAETVMGWLGEFVRDKEVRTLVRARFDKPKERWKSRFNLPFKVTMAGAEVVIDGVSLIAPKNAHQARSAFLAVSAESFYLEIDFVRPVRFSEFSLQTDLASFNEAAKMFMEEEA